MAIRYVLLSSEDAGQFRTLYDISASIETVSFRDEICGVLKCGDVHDKRRDLSRLNRIRNGGRYRMGLTGKANRRVTRAQRLFKSCICLNPDRSRRSTGNSVSTELESRGGFNRSRRGDLGVKAVGQRPRESVTALVCNVRLCAQCGREVHRISPVAIR